MGMPLLDLDQAVVTRGPDGTVTVDDPDSPILVSVRVGRQQGRLEITDLSVTARHPSARISPAALARLPLAQIRHLAGVVGHPNEAYYRQLARPKPTGARGWDDGHWERVLAVYEWAVATGRPGGGAQAVADLWGVTVNPTVYRWLATARTRTRVTP